MDRLQMWPYRELAEAGELALEPGGLAVAGDLAAPVLVGLLEDGLDVHAGIAGHGFRHAHVQHGLVHLLCTQALSAFSSTLTQRGNEELDLKSSPPWHPPVMEHSTGLYLE